MDMRWAIALGWLLSVLAVRADVPMDLDSPFEKTALIEGRAGGPEERVIRKAKRAGDNWEMELPSGGLAVFPLSQVVAILPRLPEGGEEYGARDVESALVFLQNLPAPLRNRPEASAEALEKWRVLLPSAVERDAQRAEQKNRQEAERSRADAAAVTAWVAEWSEFRKSRKAEEIQALRSRGDALLREAPGQKKTVEEGLAFLAQWEARSGSGPLEGLDKLDAIGASMEPDSFLAWMGAGVWLISLLSLLMGLGFVFSGSTRFQQQAWLGGVVFLLMGFVFLGGLGAVWWPAAAPGKQVQPGFFAGMELLMVGAKNSVQPVFYFPPVSIEAEREEVAAGLLAAVSPSEEPAGFLKARLGPGTCWLEEGRWAYQQTFTVLGLPLALTLTFAGPMPSLADWRQPVAEEAWLGRIPVPGFLGDIFFQGILDSWGQAAERVGLGRLKLEEGPGGKIRMVLPASGKRAEVAQGVTQYRRKISAEELAQAFVSGHGGEFTGKFVLLDGVVEKVSSGSEYLSATSLGDAAKGVPQKIGPNRFDVLFLRGVEKHGTRGDPLLIRCVVRSPLVFAMDSYGDLHLGPSANPIQDKPVLKRGYRVKFQQEGRVQSREISNNEIEVYGIDVASPADLIGYDPLHPTAP